MPETFFGWVWLYLEKYGTMFLSGTWTALYLAVFGTLFGCLIGFAAGVVQSIPDPAKGKAKRFGIDAAKILFRCYVGLFRGTPMMVQAMVVFYGASYLGIHLNPIAAGLAVLSMNTGAYMAETVRGGISSVDAGQAEGAKAMGMSHARTMISVILPQALRNIIPQIGNTLVSNVKDTSLLSVIAVTELFFTARTASGTYLQYFPAFFIICIIYLILTAVIGKLLHLLENKMDGPRAYQLAEEFCTAPSGHTPDQA